jgi:uncharacterized protein YacL
MLQPRWAVFLAVILLFGLVPYAGIRVALVKRDEFGRAFARLNAQPGEGHDEADRTPSKFLDTSAVIDGRVFELRRAGLLEGRMRVPRFVLAELQTLADSADEAKRSRGRRGLDLLEVARGSQSIDTLEVDYADIHDTDAKLVRLAKDTGGVLVTADHNLSGVARIQDAGVINVNEVAAALRPSYLPGERLRLQVTREGKEAGQGVGYLQDGTMVVIQGGRELIGQEIDSEVTSVLQTTAGRMVFARAIDG